MSFKGNHPYSLVPDLSRHEHAPVSGTIAEVNAALNTSPEAINQAPYEAGWLAVIEPSAWDVERSKLLDAATYFAVMQAQVQEDLKGL